MITCGVIKPNRTELKVTVHEFYEPNHSSVECFFSLADNGTFITNLDNLSSEEEVSVSSASYNNLRRALERFYPQPTVEPTSPVSEAPRSAIPKAAPVNP